MPDRSPPPNTERGVAAYWARREAILALPEAQGREEAARHFAGMPDLSEAQVRAMLAAEPRREAAPSPSPDPVRARHDAIMALPEARGRERLAAYLADAPDSQQSVAEVREALATSPLDGPNTWPPPPPAPVAREAPPPPAPPRPSLAEKMSAMVARARDPMGVPRALGAESHLATKMRAMIAAEGMPPDPDDHPATPTPSGDRGLAARGEGRLAARMRTMLNQEDR